MPNVNLEILFDSIHGKQRPTMVRSCKRIERYFGHYNGPFSSRIGLSTPLFAKHANASQATSATPLAVLARPKTSLSVISIRHTNPQMIQIHPPRKSNLGSSL